MILRILCVTSGLVMLGCTSADAQRAELRPAASRLFEASAASSIAPDSLHLHPTYWKEGALITGIPSTIFGGAFGYGMCGFDSTREGLDCVPSALAGAALFGLMGAIPGALIGGLFEKPK